MLNPCILSRKTIFPLLIKQIYNTSPRNISSGKFTRRYSTFTIDHIRYSMMECFVTVSLYHILSTACFIYKNYFWVSTRNSQGTGFSVCRPTDHGSRSYLNGGKRLLLLSHFNDNRNVSENFSNKKSQT